MERRTPVSWYCTLDHERVRILQFSFRDVSYREAKVGYLKKQRCRIGKKNMCRTDYGWSGQCACDTDRFGEDTTTKRGWTFKGRKVRDGSENRTSTHVRSVLLFERVVFEHPTLQNTLKYRYRNTFDAFRCVFQQEGIRGLYVLKLSTSS